MNTATYMVFLVCDVDASLIARISGVSGTDRDGQNAHCQNK